MNKNFFRQYNELILGLIILFFTALLFNHWTPYAADDYSYMFNLSDGSRMTSIGQIFSSLAVHYTKYGNGRLVSHFFVMLFLIGSKWIFNLVNAFLFVMEKFDFLCGKSRNTCENIGHTGGRKHRPSKRSAFRLTGNYFTMNTGASTWVNR